MEDHLVTHTSLTSAAAIIAGVDEAGRGAVAGPVVAGACIVSCELFKRRHTCPAWSPCKRRGSAGDFLLCDSKQLDAEERDVAYEWITEHWVWGAGVVDASVIEAEGILAANERAMQMAVADLASTCKPTYLLVDGCDHFWFDYPHSSVIRGDQTEPCIAAASIIAKVTRDRLMIDFGKEFPEYGFEQHKGYGTPEHMGLIGRLGPCRIHRKSFLRKVNSEQ